MRQWSTAEPQAWASRPTDFHPCLGSCPRALSEPASAAPPPPPPHLIQHQVSPAQQPAEHAAPLLALQRGVASSASAPLMEAARHTELACSCFLRVCAQAPTQRRLPPPPLPAAPQQAGKRAGLQCASLTRHMSYVVTATSKDEGWLRTSRLMRARSPASVVCRRTTRICGRGAARGAARLRGAQRQGRSAARAGTHISGGLELGWVPSHTADGCPSTPTRGLHLSNSDIHEGSTERGTTIK